ncbi:hypothetical protein ACFL6H_09995, partial [Candidatus Latescibacterota bacterium]
MAVKRLGAPKKKKREQKATNRRLPKSEGIFYIREILESDAYWDLNATAIRVLNVFYLKRRFISKKEAKKAGVPSGTITNNGQITFPYSEAEKYGILPSTFRNAIDSLIVHGFIEINIPGSQGIMQQYSIIDKWKNYPNINAKHRIIR